LDIYEDLEYSEIPIINEAEDTELMHRASSGDVQAKLHLVKEHLGLVVVLAANYASETGKSFPAMVRTGIIAVIEAANTFYCSRQSRFIDHVVYKVSEAMTDVVYTI
jgi:DNA-directed RNA polymerase sigma subunit (sigma70/sigma32)